MNTTERKISQSLISIGRREKLEKQISKEMKNKISYIEESILERRNFSRSQRYLKSIRKAPNLTFVVKPGNKEQTKESEKCNMFKDHLFSVFNKNIQATPTGTPQQRN